VDEDVQDFVYTSPVYIGISIITHEEKKKFSLCLDCLEDFYSSILLILCCVKIWLWSCRLHYC